MNIDFLYPFQFNKEAEKTQALTRFQKSLLSIFSQTTPVRICICDFSTTSIKPWVESTCRGKDFKYAHHPYPELFSPSKVRNYGVKHLVESEWFIISDIDMSYPPGYVKLIMEYAVPGVARVTPYHVSLDSRGRQFNQGEAPGNGLVNKEVFYKVKGFDEFMRGYGPEDVDLNSRMGGFGEYKIAVNLGEGTPSHLWHPPVSPRNHTHTNDVVWKKRKELLSSTAYKSGKLDLKINPVGWGEG